MAFSEICNSLIDVSVSGYTKSNLIAGNDLVRAGGEATFVSLSTKTRLPALATHIAVEVSKSCGDCGRNRYQNCAPHIHLQSTSVDIEDTILMGVHT